MAIREQKYIILSCTFFMSKYPNMTLMLKNLITECLPFSYGIKVIYILHSAPPPQKYIIIIIIRIIKLLEENSAAYHISPFGTKLRLISVKRKNTNFSAIFVAFNICDTFYWHTVWHTVYYNFCIEIKTSWNFSFKINLFNMSLLIV